MRYIKLGNSDMDISRIGVGAWAMGGNWKWGWGAQDDRDSINTIHHAISLGMNWIDTAPVYGLGHAEEVVGKAIRGLVDKPFIFTKCGFTWDSGGEVSAMLKAKTVRQEVEDSLRRLDIDAIDLYQIHWPNPVEEIEEAWQTMRALHEEGKIRYLGVSNHNIEQMRSLKEIHPITSLQPPYNLLNRDYESEILPWCQREEIGVIAYSPMASGLLTGKMTRQRIEHLDRDDWRRNADDFIEPKLTRNLQIVDRLCEVAAHHDCAATEVAIAWVLNNPSITGAIVGLRSPDQADGVTGGASITLSSAEVTFIESV